MTKSLCAITYKHSNISVIVTSFGKGGVAIAIQITFLLHYMYMYEIKLTSALSA